MRALILSTYFPPQNSPGSLRGWSFAEHWRRAGVDVTVLTTEKRPEHRGLDLDTSELRVVEAPCRLPRLLERLRSSEREALAGAVGDSPRGGVGPWLRRLRERTGIFQTVRMPDLTDWWVRPARRALESLGRFDVVLSTSGPYTTHLVARASRRSGQSAFWVADYRDLWTGSPSFVGLFPFTLVERHLERRVLAECELVTTVSEGLRDWLRERRSGPIDVIYNGYEPLLARGMPEDDAFADDGRARIVYTGTLVAPKQDPTALLVALRRLREQRPRLADRIRVSVAGPDGPEWERRSRAEGVEEHLELLGSVSRLESLRLQRDAAALLLLDWPDSRQGVLTSKLFEYLFAAAPILVIGGEAASPVADLVRECGRGAHLGSDVDAVYRVLERLAEGADALGLEPRPQACARFTRERQALALLERVEELSGVSRHATRSASSEALAASGASATGSSTAGRSATRSRATGSGG